MKELLKKEKSHKLKMQQLEKKKRKLAEKEEKCEVKMKNISLCLFSMLTKQCLSNIASNNLRIVSPVTKQTGNVNLLTGLLLHPLPFLIITIIVTVGELWYLLSTTITIC